jgi:hypothetical protein
MSKVLTTLYAALFALITVEGCDKSSYPTVNFARQMDSMQAEMPLRDHAPCLFDGLAELEKAAGIPTRRTPTPAPMPGISNTKDSLQHE